MPYFWPLLPFPETPGAQPPSAPAPTDDAYGIIRKHFNAALDGPNWQALIKAMSDADELVWRLAQNAFNQLFLSTASGKYLRRKAADSGIQEYPGLGMSDDQFRDLAIKLSTGRVTYISICEILESYYGSEALRAYADTQSGPFALVNGQTLVFKLEGVEYTYEVNEEEFEFVGAASATELAVSLTNFFERKGSTARAVVKTDPELGTNFVRVFSGALGLKSNLSIIGGTAQPFVNFDTLKDVYDGTVTGADNYQWVYSLTSGGKTQLRFTHTVNSVIPKIDTSIIKPGDYVVIGTDTATAGWYEIESASYEWVAGPLYQQTIVLTENIGTTGTIVQQSNSSYTFYRPTAHLVSNGDRTVVVSQSVPNVLDVVVPATASVDRTPETGAYIVGNESVEITSIERKNGTVSVTTAEPHGLTTGRQVDIEGFTPAKGRSWVVPANTTNLGGSFVHALARSGQISGTATDVAAGGAQRDKLSNGDIIVSGGYNSAGVPFIRSFKVSTASTVLANSTQASGAKDTTYTVTVLGDLLAQVHNAGHSVLTGPLVDQVLLTGGMAFGGELVTCQKLVGNTWVTQSDMPLPRAQHGQVTLDNGNVLVAGGATIRYNSTETCGIFQPLLNAWIPAAPMNFARHAHALHKLSDGRVLAIGGFSMGQPTNADLNGIAAHWRFDEVLGGSTPEVHSLFNLSTATGSQDSGKIGDSLQLLGNIGDEATYPPNTDLKEIFQLAFGNGFAIDFWAKGFGTGNQSLVSYSCPAPAVAADNELFRLIEAAPNVLEFSYQNGTLNTEGPFVIALPASAGNANGSWVHIAITGTPNGGNIDWRVYIDGVTISTFSGAYPSDGDNSFLSIGGDPTGVVNTWNGNIDDMRLWRVTLPQTVVREQYLQGSGFQQYGTNHQAGSNVPVLTKRTLNSCEIYDPDTDTWTLTGAMATNRALFESVVLDNGDIMVLGGVGYPQSPRMENDPDVDGGLWPNENLAQVEIYTPSTGKWRRGPTMPTPRCDFWSCKIGNRLYTGTTLYNYNWTPTDGFVVPTDSEGYWLDLDTFKWGVFPLGASPELKGWATSTDTDVAIMGGFQAFVGTASRRFDAIVGDNAVGSSGGINGTHQVTVISPTVFTFESEDPYYTSNLGMDEVLSGSGSTFAFSNPKTANRAANITTVTAEIPAGTLAVWVNSTDANFSSGLKTILTLTDTTFTYAEVAANAAGTVYVSSPLSVPTSEHSEATGTGGIFVIDPTRWTMLSGESTLTTEITEGNAYSVVNVGDTSTFPDGNGYIVLGLGTALESKPLKYLEKISTTELLMAGFTAEQTWPVGTTVTQIQLEVSNDIGNAAWITGALAAQLAAERDVRESVARDVDLNWSVIYPGDRGLGGEGAANSDAPTVWGPDEFDSGF